MRERYYLKADHQTEWNEVTREQFIHAEQDAGFRSKFGPRHVATGGFSGAGMSGRVKYVDDDASNEHKGDVIERRERDRWVLSGDGLTILSAPSYRPLLRSTFEQWQEDAPHRWWTREEAQAVIREVFDNHNQHATLTEQRDRLVEALREVRTKFFEHAQAGAYVVKGNLVPIDDEQHPWIPGVEAPRAIEIIDAALATIEQSSPSTTGDEQGGGKL